MQEKQNTNSGGTVGEGTEKKASALFIAVYVLAYFGIFMTVLTPFMISLPIRVRQIDPQNYLTNLSIILSLGAFLAMVSNPLFGRLSDRTTSRLGMRRPWLLVGILGALCGFLLIGMVPSVLAVAIGWCIVQISLNIMQAVANAILPDQIPHSQRGRVSGLLAMCIAMSTLFGAIIVDRVLWSPFWMFMLPFCIMCITSLALAVVIKDRTQTKEQVPPYSIMEFLSSFWVDWLKYPDFSWIWLSRFLRFLGQAIYFGYLVYLLGDQLGKSGSELSGVMVITTGTYAIAGALGANLAGPLSDYFGHTKALLITGALIFSTGLVVLGFSHVMPAFYAGVLLCGLGRGMFVALDFVVVSDVLPKSSAEAAKNFGVFNIATALPQSIAPVFAPFLLGIGSGHNYAVLYGAGAAFSIIGAALVLLIRKVR